MAAIRYVASVFSVLILAGVMLLPWPARAASLGAGCPTAGATAMSSLAAEGMLTCMGGVWSRAATATSLAQFMLPDITTIACNAANDGVIARNYATSKTQTCNGAAASWSDVVAGAGGGIITDPNTGQLVGSCYDIRNAQPTSATGSYSVVLDTNAAVRKFQVYCDMTHFGGGWTRLFANDSGACAAGDTGCDATPFAKGLTNIKEGSPRGASPAMPYVKFRIGQVMIVDENGKAATWNCEGQAGNWTSVIGQSWGTLTGVQVAAGDRTKSGIFCRLLEAEAGQQTMPSITLNTTAHQTATCLHTNGYWSQWSYSSSVARDFFTGSAAQVVIGDNVGTNTTYSDGTDRSPVGPPGWRYEGSRPCTMSTKADMVVSFSNLWIMPAAFVGIVNNMWGFPDSYLSPNRITQPIGQWVGSDAYNFADMLPPDFSFLHFWQPGNQPASNNLGYSVALFTLSGPTGYTQSSAWVGDYCGGVQYNTWSGTQAQVWYVPGFLPLQYGISATGAITWANSVNAGNWLLAGQTNPVFRINGQSLTFHICGADGSGGTGITGTVRGGGLFRIDVAQSQGESIQTYAPANAPAPFKSWAPSKAKHIYIR